MGAGTEICLQAFDLKCSTEKWGQSQSISS